jgi:hypothetical protein
MLDVPAMSSGWTYWIGPFHLLYQADGRDGQRLAERVGAPSCACARLEGDDRPTDPRQRL